MATEAQAEKVLKRCAERLRRLGAHSLSVREGSEVGFAGPIIRALRAPGSGRRLPKSVSATVAGKRVRIPVHIEDQEQFEAESL